MAVKRNKGAKLKDGTGRTPGRPTRCTAKVIDSMCTAIAAGCYIETAAEYTGIVKRKFYEWLKKGAADEEAGKRSIYRTLKERITKAMADAELNDLATITMHAKGYIAEREVTVVTVDANGNVVDEKTTREQRFRRDWTAAAWRLERKHPERWGRRDTTVNVDATPPATIFMPEKDVLPGAVEVRRQAARNAAAAAAAGMREHQLATNGGNDVDALPPSDCGSEDDGGNGAGGA